MEHSKKLKGLSTRFFGIMSEAVKEIKAAMSDKNIGCISLVRNGNTSSFDVANVYGCYADDDGYYYKGRMGIIVYEKETDSLLFLLEEEMDDLDELVGLLDEHDLFPTEDVPTILGLAKQRPMEVDMFLDPLDVIEMTASTLSEIISDRIIGNEKEPLKERMALADY